MIREMTAAFKDDEPLLAVFTIAQLNFHTYLKTESDVIHDEGSQGIYLKIFALEVLIDE